MTERTAEPRQHEMVVRGRSKFPVTTEAHRIIEALGLTAGQLADVGKCSRSGAQNWRKGVAVPTDDRKILIENRWSELHRGTWSMFPQWPGQVQVDPSPSITLTDPDPLDEFDFVDARTAAKAHLVEVQKMIRDAIFDRRIADVMRLRDLERKAIVDIARFSGELNALDEGKLTSTQRWQEVRGVILKALSPYPEALADLTQALEGIGA